MSISTSSNRLDEFEEIAADGGSTRHGTAIGIVRRGSAGNDEAHDDPATTHDGVEPWAKAPVGVDASGDRPTTDAASCAGPTSYELQRAARIHRSFTVGEIIFAAIRAADTITRQAHLRYRLRAEAAAIHDTLRRLDDRTLHDLGFDRSEIRSVAAEVTEEADRTRVRALPRAKG